MPSVASPASAAPSNFPRERFGVKPQVVRDESRDEIVIVTVSGVAAQTQRLAHRCAALLEKLRQQLTLGQELVGEALVDEDLGEYTRTAGVE